ncbi:bacteriocin [Dolosigranulum pigrum]|nr:bacteriocin [Dolosigranulum pigrum]QJS96497.1 bacteriocin [Dolosigranulum pigrum]QTJ44359.1 bacteriocin [Dolosigranulum pigrum]
MTKYKKLKNTELATIIGGGPLLIIGGVAAAAFGLGAIDGYMEGANA